MQSTVGIHTAGAHLDKLLDDPHCSVHDSLYGLLLGSEEGVPPQLVFDGNPDGGGAALAALLATQGLALALMVVRWFVVRCPAACCCHERFELLHRPRLFVRH